MPDLNTALRNLAEAAKVFKGGTIITPENRAQKVTEMHEYYAAVQTVKELGATPYELERAMSGDVIGGSFR